MSANQWNTTAGPRQTKTAETALADLHRLAQCYVELSGVVGGEERPATLWTPFGGGAHTEESRESFRAAWEGVGERFAWTITSANYKDVAAAATAAKATVKLAEVDKRQTPQQIEEGNALVKAAEAAREAKAAAWRQTHCLPEPVTVPAGSMAILLTMTYDGSDSMSDYFAPHCRYGDPMLLGIARMGSRTESVARQILARYPTLSALSWTWRTENYSGGHGNYLESEYTEERTEPTAAKSEGRALRYEIIFDARITQDKPMYAWKEFPGQTPASTTQYEQPDPGTTTAAIISENDEKDGIEIRFPTRPDAAILAQLKAHGWKWAKTTRCWYKRRSEEARDFARHLIGAA